MIHYFWQCAYPRYEPVISYTGQRPGALVGIMAPPVDGHVVLAVPLLLGLRLDRRLIVRGEAWPETRIEVSLKLVQNRISLILGQLAIFDRLR